MSKLIHLESIADLYRFFRLKEPVLHPLVAVIDFASVKELVTEETKVSGDLYYLLFKNYNRNNLKYGRKLVDFQDGSLMCMAPNQVIEMDNDIDTSAEMIGWGLFFHPDLIRGTSLYGKMRNYSFFSYEIAESLHLAVKEHDLLYECVRKVESELKENIDVHSQAIIVSTIELLLNYCTRFYGRQFITRKTSNHSVVVQVEQLLKEYFDTGKAAAHGLPSVQYLADKVFLSTSYLGDLLKKETGKNAQEHIHYYLIEEAKNILVSTDRSIGEIAYELGFEYPQYFNKLFKQKTGETPAAFRSRKN